MKTLTLPKYKHVILNSWPKQEKNGTPLFWVELKFELSKIAMIFSVFIFVFLFRNNCKKEHSHENDFFHSYDNYSVSVLTMGFERHLTVEDFTDMDQHSWKISWNGDGSRCLENYQLHKNLSLFFKEHFTKTFKAKISLDVNNSL